MFIQGISFEDYFAFNHFLKCISDVDTALTFYHLAGAPIDRQTLKHVSLAVANVNLRDHIIDVVFTLFDVDSMLLFLINSLEQPLYFYRWRSFEQQGICYGYETKATSRLRQADGYWFHSITFCNDKVRNGRYFERYMMTYVFSMTLDDLTQLFLLIHLFNVWFYQYCLGDIFYLEILSNGIVIFCICPLNVLYNSYRLMLPYKNVPLFINILFIIIIIIISLLFKKWHIYNQ